MRTAIERLLHAAGMECRLFGSAEELLAEGDSAGAACVISDHRLPAMSGLELLSALRSRGGWPPVIMITAFDTPGQREEATRRGAQAYLVKPFSGIALLDAVRLIVDSEPGQSNVQGG